ncbi:putative Cytidylate kinase [Syntrophobacter sp. SbD1]|nr:putative Cytidylate kinase [Syntrophobacter sp. SbD1]
MRYDMAVLTISRQLGTGGRELGLMLSNSLGYRFVDRERILAAIKAAGHRWEKWTEGMDEHTPRVWEKYDWSYQVFVALVQSTIIKEAVSGRVVIMGRGGNYLLKGVPFALRVRVDAPFEKRAAWVYEREEIDEESARRLVERTDSERAGYLLNVYGRDGKDPADYDIVFDSTAMPVDRICAAVERLLCEKDLLADEKSVSALKMRSLSADIKAHLFTTLPFFMSTMEVEFDDEAVCVRGVVRLPRERALIVDECTKAAGGAPLRFELKYRQ